jgi:hypothetical protein
MRGRDTPSPELTQTAQYIAGQIREFGLELGAGDSYIQTYPMTRISPASADRQVLQISGPTGEADLEYGVDFFVQATGESAEADGVLVLVEGAEDMPNAASQIAVLRVTTANIRQVFGGRLRDAIRAANPAGLVVVLDLPETQFNRFRGFLGSERVVYGDGAWRTAGPRVWRREPRSRSRRRRTRSVSCGDPIPTSATSMS